MKMTRPAEVIALAAVLALLAGCTSSVIPPQPEPTMTHNGVSVQDGLLTFEPQADGFGMTALFQGTLTLETGCLGFDGYSLAFPKNLVTWDGVTLTFGDERYRIGDELSVGGGQIPEDPLPKSLVEQCGDKLIVVSGPA